MAPALPDPFDDALQDLRIGGSVLLNCSYAAPWAVAVPDAATLVRLLALPPRSRVMVFHGVRQGACELRLAGNAHALAAGEAVLLPDAPAHVLGEGGARAVPLEHLLAGEGPRHAEPGAAGAATLLCGVFVARPTPLNPLLSALPSLLHARATPGAGLLELLDRLAREPSGAPSFRATRLLELLCAELCSLHREAGTATGWLAALADPRLAPALRLLQASPEQPLSVARLAQAVALSPSRFAARFRAATGASVMAHATAWRMNLACRLLADEGLPVHETARRVGYDSLAAFSRCFKAHVGMAPSAWRASQQGASAEERMNRR